MSPLICSGRKEGYNLPFLKRTFHADFCAPYPLIKPFATVIGACAFAEAWPDAEIVQQAVGQLPWGHNLALLTRLKNTAVRLGRGRISARGALPVELQTSLPSIEQIGRELGSGEDA